MMELKISSLSFLGCYTENACLVKDRIVTVVGLYNRRCCCDTTPLSLLLLYTVKRLSLPKR